MKHKKKKSKKKKGVKRGYKNKYKEIRGHKRGPLLFPSISDADMKRFEKIVNKVAKDNKPAPCKMPGIKLELQGIRKIKSDFDNLLEKLDAFPGVPRVKPPRALKPQKNKKLKIGERDNPAKELAFITAALSGAIAELMNTGTEPSGEYLEYIDSRGRELSKPTLKGVTAVTKKAIKSLQDFNNKYSTASKTIGEGESALIEQHNKRKEIKWKPTRKQLKRQETLNLV